MITVVGIDGRYFAIRSEQIAQGVLAALPHFIPVDFDPAHTAIKEPPKVQDRCVDIDIVLVHNISTLKDQNITFQVGRLADTLKNEFGIESPSGGAQALVDHVLDAMRQFAAKASP